MSEDNQRSSNDILMSLVSSRDSGFLFAMRFLRAAGFPPGRTGREGQEWALRRAAEGSDKARYASALLLGHGVYGPPRREEAVELCQKAADAGFPPAILLLGTYHESGWGGLQPDSGEALRLMKLSATLGYTPAMHAVALYYLDNDPDLKRRPEALTYLRDAAELGDSNAQFTLAKELLKTDRPACIKDGLGYLNKSAELLNPHAHEMLGFFLRDGRYGLPKNEVRARYHFEIAKRLEAEIWNELMSPST